MDQLADEVEKAVVSLENGEVIIHATEAIFGFAAKACSYDACMRVWKIKNRPFNKKFIVIFPSVREVGNYAIIEQKNQKKILETWPGHITWVLRAKDTCPDWLKDSDNRIAVRVPSHLQMLQLCKKSGPLISTSANVANHLPAKNYEEAIKEFAGNSLVSFILRGKTGGKTRPSLIYDGLTCKILRS
ncbi:MAG: L-threonylcarbamoyladenylate synthase [Pseudomonadota bacterium]|nr:L-threonylcarbamoyladenylate synthase [Pseudomonadota bacterium]